MSIGFSAARRERAVALATARAYADVPVSTVSDSMNRLTAGGAALRPMHDGTRMSGPAVTVRTRPGDNLMVHVALDLADPGDVIVVDAGGDLTNAIIGELMAMHATTRGLAGIVINGAIRDSATIRGGSFPVFAAGVTHRGPYKDGPGEINVPIAINGMTIHPGDLLIGDADGILAVPFEHVDSVLIAATKKNEHELRAAVRFREGTSDRSAVRERARTLGADLSAFE